MISRRALLAGIGASLAVPAFARTNLISAQTPFSAQMVHDMARALAAAPYRPVPMIPRAWRDLTYDEFGHIWFDSRNAIWMSDDRPVKVDLFTAGLYAQHPVEINIVEDGMAKTLAYDFDLFDTTDQFPDLPIDETMGYSGFRLRAELNLPEIFEEFMVFQGASYFRAIASGQTYGISARGLALDTATPKGEEFPAFTRFWIEAPSPEARSFVVHAILDGPSCSGAYRFVITPGTPTEVTVDMTLFPRVALSHVGIAPLTSMFFYDETNRHRFDDFRPAVHDSEGLLIWNGNGERIWRPLANPARVEISAFGDENPQGFGLMQRTRRAEDYADLEAHYEARPSLWITPQGNWGKGTVDLVEIPTDKEIYDNIVAYWRPAAPLDPQMPHRFQYHMAWGDAPAGLPDVAHVTNTRIGKGFDQTKTVCTIDFADHALIPADPAQIRVVLTSRTVDLSDGVVQRNPGTGGVRLAFSFLPEDHRTIEMRAQLFNGTTPITEVWLYRWTA